jgi:hypothetical protein
MPEVIGITLISINKNIPVIHIDLARFLAKVKDGKERFSDLDHHIGKLSGNGWSVNRKSFAT